MILIYFCTDLMLPGSLPMSVEKQKNRRSYKPQPCGVFNADSIALESQEQYEFSLNKEALKALPDIINNHVQKLVDGGSADAGDTAFFKKKRHIGIVFSGGPAPGGHNVIAGIFDAAKKTNPDSKVFGFVLGPDGILENRYVEITADLVDTHRNMGGFTMIKNR